MENNDKLEKIRRTVYESVSAEAAKLVEGATAQKEAVLAGERTRLAAEIEEYTRRQTAKIKSDATNAVGMFEIERRRQLIEVRDEYISRVFDAAKAKLEKFTEGYKYELYLHKLYDRALARLGSDITVKVRAADISIMSRIAPGQRCEASRDIRYGGLIAESGRLIADLTLDRRLIEAKDSFVSSGIFSIDG